MFSKLISLIISNKRHTILMKENESILFGGNITALAYFLKLQPMFLKLVLSLYTAYLVCSAYISFNIQSAIVSFILIVASYFVFELFIEDHEYDKVLNYKGFC